MQLHCLLFHFPGFVLDWQQQVNSQLNNRPIIARLFGILLSGAVGGKYPKKQKRKKEAEKFLNKNKQRDDGFEKGDRRGSLPRTTNPNSVAGPSWNV